MNTVLHTFLISMTPVLELRGAIPFGITSGLSYQTAYFIAVLGNIIPLPFIILFVRKVFRFIRRNIPALNTFVDRLENKAKTKGNKIQNYRKLGLFLFVAIPLPGTGGWTGALIASFLDIRLKDAIWPLVFGVMTAGVLIMCLTYGVSAIL